MGTTMTIQTDTVETNPKEADNIVQILKKQTQIDINKIQDENNKKLYIGAINLLNTLEKQYKLATDLDNLAQRHESYKNMVKREARNPDNIQGNVTKYWDSFRQLSKKIKNNKDSALRIYEALMTFQKIINEVLGQKVQMVWVFSDLPDIGPLIVEADSKYFVNPQINSGELQYRYNVAKKQYQELKHKNSLKLFVEPGEITSLTSAYNETIWRFRHANYKNKKNGKMTSMKVVLYLINNHWYGVKIAAGGDISEAYADFALNKLNDLFVKLDLEHKVQRFLLGVEGVAGGVLNVDNQSGLLAGDLSKKTQDGSIQYAVKGTRASSLGIKQIMDLAEEIRNKAGEYSRADLQSLKEYNRSIKQTRNVLLPSLNKYVLEQLQVSQKEFKQLEQTIRARSGN